ncbi:hypothetical protein [Sinorhizobium fredii]|uniref:hypothetical protein n=1 Tax=Rhizobium fredii TaxID=380 RepID=UPI0004B21B31|nr:hypothetical protein [Sinorhizobium fredii]ASY68854.1 hypothetical protein SF83666_c14330 [Sinorhizobium fredii CCBAU 83666]
MTTKKHHFGYFSARLLWAIEPFVQHHRNTETLHRIDGNVFLEPSSSGGAFFGAVHGHAMAVFHDPDAYCSGAITLDIPESAFAAAKPADPFCFNYCGDHHFADAPEWMQPGHCYVHEAGIFINPKMRHPQWANMNNEFQPCLYSRTASVGAHTIGDDFRLKDGSPAEWRKALTKAVSEATAPAGDVAIIDPKIVNLFSRIVDLCWSEADQDQPRRVFHRRTASVDQEKYDGPILLTIEGRPDFVGAYMPMRKAEPQPVSGIFLQAAE